MHFNMIGCIEALVNVSKESTKAKTKEADSREDLTAKEKMDLIEEQKDKARKNYDLLDFR